MTSHADAVDRYPSVLLDVRCGVGGMTTLVDTASEAGDTGRMVVEQFGGGPSHSTGDSRGCNTIEWTESEVVVRTSRQNSTSLYRWGTPGGDRVLIGSDLAELTARVIASEGVGSDLFAQVRTVRRSISKIGGGRTVVFTRGRDGLRVDDTETATWRPERVSGETAIAAGRRQLEALRREVLALGDVRPVTAVVSGGVDSGLVAVLAQQAGILDHLATLGTPWGDEYAETEELGACLGLPVQHLVLSEEDILRALPAAIRMLGQPDREPVSGAVNLAAVFQQGQLPRGAVLTGFGADLINSGHRVESHAVENISAAVAQRLADAAGSEEFSGVVAAAHGYTQHHMYWRTGVIQAAIDTAPELMRFRDREKGHMRAAAAELLPDGIAWRRKQALHHGSGVERNLDAAIARRVGVDSFDVERFYRFIDVQLVATLVDSPHERIDSEKCLEAAIAAYRRHR
ncbi:asparagine synthase C-terminal domain-containing protein [Nocardia sp. NPDC059764]|uniref:asparagine synthase C-terminal domain-containing protein n=1 Tax=Nocardia sp. NPDC059764 TaxID=3346939 RepID=UPI003655BCBB